MTTTAIRTPPVADVAPDDGRSAKAGTQTLDRGLDLLEMAVQDSATVIQLAERSGLSRAIAYRLVGSLAARGFLAMGPNNQVRGGRQLLRLRHLVQDQTDLVALARPQLEWLAQETGMSAFMGRREGDDSVHMLRVPGRERVAVTTQPGTRRRLGETGLGKALLLDDGEGSWRRLFAMAAEPHRRGDWLAAMHAAVERGVVLQCGPAPDHIHSVAAPVRDAGGGIVAAINVAAAAPYLDADRMDELVPLLRTAAAEIGAALGREGTTG
ncbi:helix-turn-helix domain-containing protein [Sphingomonas sp. A2-49]|uniref:IclR family transcriptional regulator n=1 Tax=Sphingomonas sp. A2-49 TaxID=1391375 RepID=UPI0021D066AB|nr:IclR family transcriptional regulator C-terminal domain-containing protein [Sphingomonas sp. A2-49]MCU6453605.1 helix-turn-helix domain-containing protein [Sphingomonas sp. A2-49]